MGVDWIAGVISAVEGERDPRNLLFIFEFMQLFLQKFPLENLADDMFEVFACYFPIDFNPAPNVPALISRELLQESLCNCLTATDAFCAGCVDLVVEKLDSELHVAKADSFLLLVRMQIYFI